MWTTEIDGTGSWNLNQIELIMNINVEQVIAKKKLESSEGNELKKWEGYKMRKVSENNSLNKEIRKLLELCKKDEKDNGACK